MGSINAVFGSGAKSSRLDRWLGIFAKVEAGEGWGALLLAANIFCLLASYYLLKTARESLILSEGTPEVKSYAAAAQAMILLGGVPLYGAIASRVNRGRLINGVLLFFVSHLMIFRLLAAHGYHVGIPFFLWVGVFNLMIVAQFWAFANDLYSVERGQRLFPLVGVGASLGAWCGARTASMLMAHHLEPSDLFALAGCGLFVCIGLNCWVSRTMRAPRMLPAPGEAERPLGGEGGLRLIIRDRYLRLIALLVIVANVVNTIGEYLLGHLVVADATRALAEGTANGFSKAQLIGAFYGDFFAWVNLLSVGIQLLIVSRTFKRLGVGGALLILPLVACGTYGLFAFAPFIGAIRIGKIAENSTDYSLQNTARHALFLPTSREAKFKAKQAIDGLCWRLGDLLQAGIVFVGVRLAFDVGEFALLNELLVGLWVLVALFIGREYRRRTRLAHADSLAA